MHTLKQVHSATDIGIMANQARSHLHELNSLIDEILHNIHHWDVLKQMGRVTHFRTQIKPKLNNPNVYVFRDLLFLDIALQFYVRNLVEKIIHCDIGFHNYVNELQMILQNLCLTYNWIELHICKSEWNQIVIPASK